MSEQNIHQELKAIKDYWDYRADACSSDCEKVDSSKRSQLMRFEAFIQMNDLQGKSILDVGCGAGDLWKHLQARNIQCDYTGFDISSSMVKRCHERFPEAVFESGDFDEWGRGKQFDYTVAIAIHNIKIEGGAEIFRQTTQRQFDMARVATHLSLLTDRYPGFDPHIQAWRAEEMLKIALEITPYVVLRHDYLPHDFSITLYHEPLIDTLDFDFAKYAE
jgi:SAM-dependent methyltransferase